jgi:hypothetical protein
VLWSFNRRSTAGVRARHGPTVQTCAAGEQQFDETRSDAAHDEQHSDELAVDVGIVLMLVGVRTARRRVAVMSESMSLFAQLA